MQKYDFIKKQYTPYTPPQNGHCDIMVHANEELNCAACGRTINKHNAYTSAAIQNDIGIGYLICKSCYEHELKKKKKKKKKGAPPPLGGGGGFFACKNMYKLLPFSAFRCEKLRIAV